MQYPEVPTITLPDGTSPSILSGIPPEKLPSLPPSVQRKLVRALEDLLQKAHAMPRGKTVKEDQDRHVFIDAVSWQLATCLRYSMPTRIAEAVAPLTFLTEAHRRIHKGTKVDVIPTLYLGVALSRIEGEEERALKTFKEAFDNLHTSSQVPAKNLIWARANMARMLRGMGRNAEASIQERLTREWIVNNSLDFFPNVITNAIADDVGTGAHILDHRDVIAHFSRFRELGPNQWVLDGKIVLTK